MKLKEAETEEQEELEAIDNKLELLKYTSQVQSRIKDEISTDFVLAKLSEKDKEGITEMTSNAYFVKRMMSIIKKKAKRWEWDSKEKKWEKKEAETSDRNKIEEISKRTFDMFMTRIYMTAILNRNVERNYLLNILAGLKEEEEKEEDTEIKSKLREVLRNEEKKEAK